MLKKITFINLLLLFSFQISAQSWWGGSKKIKGNGTIITTDRTTDSYNAISIGGSFDVYLVKGKEGKITIEGEENIVPYIVTEVDRGTLKVRYQKNINIRTTRKLLVTVTYNDIEKLALGGSGNVNCESVIKADDFVISLGGSGNINLNVEAKYIKSNIGGSGNIKLSGKSDELNCSIAGSGSIRAYELETNTLNASIAGSGNIRTTVKNEIKAKVVGSGSIYYKGNPKYVDSKSIGSGNIIDRN